VGLYLVGFGAIVGTRSTKPMAHRLAKAVGALVVTQWIAGLINIALLAPVWLQLLHLLLADLVWLTLVLLAAAVLAEPARAHAGAPAARLAEDAAPAGAGP
jgi:heme a synthase